MHGADAEQCKNHSNDKNHVILSALWILTILILVVIVIHMCSPF